MTHQQKAALVREYLALKELVAKAKRGGAN